MKFNVHVFYGAQVNYDKYIEVEAESAEDAEAQVEELDHDVTDGTWDVDEVEVDYSDLGFDVEEV